jgi:hypothetical protein
MKFSLLSLSGFSLFIAGIIGIFKFKRMDKTYYPFLFLIEIGCVNELLSYILIQFHHHTLLNNNIYALFESLLILWFFNNLKVFKNSKNIYLFILSLFLLSWSLQMLQLKTLDNLYLYFRILYSFIIVFLSIYTINSILITETNNILKNPTFIICTGFVIFFTYYAIMNCFWLYGLTKSVEFRIFISKILAYINLFCNLIYAIALIWIPRHRPSILLSSLPA